MLLSVLVSVLLSKQGQLSDLSISLDGRVILFLFIALLLSILNWMLEAIKWSQLIKKVQFLSATQLGISICLGISANLLAPNRTGDLLGRMRFIPFSKKWEALYINFFNAMGQLLITLIAGLLTLMIHLELFISVSSDLKMFYSILILSLITAAIFIYLFSNVLLRIYAGWNKGVNHTNIQISAKERLQTLLLSLGRYLVFVGQFFLLLTGLGAEINLLESFYVLSLIFFLNSFVPSNWLLELASKGSIAYFIFDLFGYDPLAGVAAAVLLWLVNLLLPTLIGILYLKDIDWLNITKKLS